MLAAKRKQGERMVIDLRAWNLGLIYVAAKRANDRRIQVGIDASRCIPVHREEVFEAIERSKQEPAA